MFSTTKQLLHLSRVKCIITIIHYTFSCHLACERAHLYQEPARLPVQTSEPARRLRATVSHKDWELPNS